MLLIIDHAGDSHCAVPVRGADAADHGADWGRSLRTILHLHLPILHPQLAQPVPRGLRSVAYVIFKDMLSFESVNRGLGYDALQ
jgi:hypothetical protein